MRKIGIAKLYSVNEDAEELFTKPDYQEGSSSLSIINLIKSLEGYKIRLREIHWSTPKHHTHLLTDEIIEELTKFEDSIAEQVMGLNNFRIPIASISNINLPDATLLKEALNGLLNVILNFKSTIESDTKFSGVISLIDDFAGDISKYLYLETFE